MIYIAIIIPYLHKTNIIFEIIAVSIILIAIILIGYYFGRDFFAGIVFKFAYKIKEGDFIQYKDTVGKVKKPPALYQVLSVQSSIPPVAQFA